MDAQVGVLTKGADESVGAFGLTAAVGADKAAVSWNFDHCSARASLKI